MVRIHYLPVAWAVSYIQFRKFIEPFLRICLARLYFWVGVLLAWRLSNMIAGEDALWDFLSKRALGMYTRKKH